MWSYLGLGVVTVVTLWIITPNAMLRGRRGKSNKSFLIIGGCHGLGAECARLLIAQGHSVVVTSRSDCHVEGSVGALICDVKEYQQVEGALEKASQLLGERLMW